MRIIANTTQEGGVAVEILDDDGGVAPVTTARRASSGVAASAATEARDGGASPLSVEKEIPQPAAEPISESGEMDGGAGPAQ